MSDIPDFLMGFLDGTAGLGFFCGNPGCKYKDKPQEKGGIYFISTGKPAEICKKCEEDIVKGGKK